MVVAHIHPRLYLVASEQVNEKELPHSKLCGSDRSLLWGHNSRRFVSVSPFRRFPMIVVVRRRLKEGDDSIQRFHFFDAKFLGRWHLKGLTAKRMVFSRVALFPIPPSSSSIDR